jgi:hypothetical protein
MSRQTRVERFTFRGAQAPPLLASRQGRWAKADTSAVGSPTVQSGSSGAMELTLDPTNEVQNICLYFGDVLPYDIDDIVRVSIVAAITNALNAAISAAFGLTSARNDAIGSIAQRALFRCVGNNAILAETADGVTTQASIPTGLSLGPVFRRFSIDLSEGNLAQSPPSQSLGGKADVRFHVSNDNGSLRRVASGTRFRLDAYGGGLQLFAQLQKTAVVNVATLYLLEYELEYRLPV